MTSQILFEETQIGLSWKYIILLDAFSASAEYLLIKSRRYLRILYDVTRDTSVERY